jgi:hypothetical protein
MAPPQRTSRWPHGGRSRRCPANVSVPCLRSSLICGYFHKLARPKCVLSLYNIAVNVIRRSTAPNNEAEQTPAPLGAAAAAKQQRKRPKVTFDLLKQSNGLPDLYHNFPILFRQQFRGKGHEVSDLRRLLELYKRWQDRVFPHGEFDHFIFAVEKLSGSNIVKKELQDMRVDLLQAVTKAAQGPKEADSDFDDRALPDDDDLLALAAAEDEVIPLQVNEDDELIALLAQDVGDTLRPNPEGQAEPPADLPDDDELLALVAETDVFLPSGEAASAAAAHGQLATQPPTVDDDELLALIAETCADADNN